MNMIDATVAKSWKLTLPYPSADTPSHFLQAKGKRLRGRRLCRQDRYAWVSVLRICMTRKLSLHATPNSIIEATIRVYEMLGSEVLLVLRC